MNNDLNLDDYEIELALLCCRITLSDHELDIAKSLCKKIKKWDNFINFIFHHRITAIAFKALKPIQNHIPEKVYVQLKGKTIQIGQHSLLNVSYLRTIVNIFEDNNIYNLPFKGPALSEQIYNDTLLRPFSDLDILVNKADAQKAYSLLLNLGFEPQYGLGPSQFLKFISNEDHFTFYQKQKKIILELHWDMAGLYLSLPLILPTLKPFIGKGLLGDKNIKFLNPEPLFVYLCVHGAKHIWDNLESICILSEMLKSKTDLNWDEIIKLSVEWRCQKMVYLGIFLASSLLKAPVPKSLRVIIHQDQTVLKLAESVKTGLLNHENLRSDEPVIDRFSSFHIKIRDTLADKIRYSLRLIFRPTEKEWLYYPLPSYLSALHYFIRPVRLILSQIRGHHV